MIGREGVESGCQRRAIEVAQLLGMKLHLETELVGGAPGVVDQRADQLRGGVGLGVPDEVVPEGDRAAQQRGLIVDCRIGQEQPVAVVAQICEQLLDD